MAQTLRVVDPYTDPTSIGNLAITKGWATKEDVGKALKRQETRMPLGELLVEANVLTITQLDDLLFEQKLLRDRVKPSIETKLRLQHQRRKLQEVTSGLRVLALDMREFVKGS